MISNECNFAEFMGAVRGKDFYEVIRLADLEATAAERLLLRVREDDSRKDLCGKIYARRIKRFIDYMRFEVKLQGAGARVTDFFIEIDSHRRPQRRV